MKKIFTLAIIMIFAFSSIFAQCNMDRHNTTWYDGWTSCDGSLSPNIPRGESHWIMYDLGYRYQLKSSHWWNHNEVEHLDNGAKTIMVDYSNDGISWEEWGSFELTQATGINTYEGELGPDFSGLEAQYVLFTILNNYGGDCYGLGEVKIEVDYISSTEITDADPDNFDINAYPNPFKDQITIAPSVNLGSDYNIRIEDMLGKTIATLPPSNSKNAQITYDGSSLRSGVYFVVLTKEGKTVRKKILKVE